jgi:hypothetical protein
VQLYREDGQHFSFPITTGEAGWGMQGSDLTVTGASKTAIDVGQDIPVRCTNCGYTASQSEFEPEGSDTMVCPWCGATGEDNFEDDSDYTASRKRAATTKDYKPGQRVQLHPATDAWMQGDRYGQVVKSGREKVHVKMDRSGRTLRVHPDNIQGVVD